MTNETSYARLRMGRPPNKLLLQAIRESTQKHGRALELGAGSLTDARTLAEAGYTVDAVDRDPEVLLIAQELPTPNIQVIQADIADYPIRPNTYAMIVSINSLPFLDKKTIEYVMPRIVNGLVENGLFCATFFGPKDDWASRSDMSFLSKKEVREILGDLDCLYLEESERDRADMRGTVKHWHLVRGIFRKGQKHQGTFSP